MNPVAPVFRTGTRVQALQALRDRLAEDLDLTTSARDVASLSQRLLDVEARLADLDQEEEHDELADLIALPGGATG